MNRPVAKGKKPSSKPRSVRISWDLTSTVRWFLDRPRGIRILLVSLFALAATLALFPITDELYIRFLFDESTRLLPSVVSVGFGIVMYIGGWWLVVGTVGEERPVRPLIFWYLIIGILATLLVIGLLIQGYSIGTAPDL